MINLFLDHLLYERNLSGRTIGSYREALTQFEAYFKSLEGDLTWESVDSDVVRDWVESLMDQGKAPATVNRNLSALRTFFKFALKKGLLESDPAHMLSGPKKQKPLPQFATEREMDWLLDEAEWGSEYKDVLARTIIILLYEAGLRQQELVGLNDSDVDWSAHQLKVTGKRRKQRLIPFGPELEDQLNRYLDARSRQEVLEKGPLLISPKGRRVTPGLVYYTVKTRLTAATNLKKRSPHVLRHSFATAMLNGGARLETIQKLLGHARLTTTEVYTHTTFEQLRQVYEKAHPRD